MSHAFLGRLDVAVKHGGVAEDAQLVGGPVHVEPARLPHFALERFLVNAIVEDLGPAARQTAQPRCPQALENLADAQTRPADPREVDDLDGGKSLDVQARARLPDRPAHFLVVGERQPRMQPAHDVHFRGSVVRRLAGLSHNLIHRQFVPSP